MAPGPNQWGQTMNYSFNSISPDDPRLASVPDAPWKATATALPTVRLPGPPKGYFIQRSREQRSPDRQASIERRRTPGRLASTAGGLWRETTPSANRRCAKIVADEFLAHGVCDLSRNEIAARAGVSHTFAERTMLLARARWLDQRRAPPAAVRP